LFAEPATILHRGREDVALRFEDAVPGDDVASDPGCDRLRSRGIDVGDGDRGPGVRQVLGERRADAARTLHEDASPCRIVGSECPLEAGADPVVDADRRRWGRAPRPAGPDGPPEDVLGPLADHVHVRLAGVDVGARPVGPTERRNEVAVRDQQRAPPVPARDLGDGQDRLAAAERKSRDSELPRHRGREAHRVLQRVGRRVVDLHPRPAPGGAEERRVDADEDPRAALPISMDDGRLAVPRVEQGFERRHVAPWARPGALSS
jgi:hypothetical protein